MEPRFKKGDVVRVHGVYKGRVLDVHKIPGDLYTVATGKPVYRYRTCWSHPGGGSCGTWLEVGVLEPWDPDWETPWFQRPSSRVNQRRTDPKWLAFLAGEIEP